MKVTKRQISKLRDVVALVSVLLDQAESTLKKDTKLPIRTATRKRDVKARRSVRRRRSANEAARMRTDILAKRAKGVSATKLAEKYGVSTAYIYMIKK